VVVFGPGQFLPRDADRATQRELDFRLIEMMGDMVELNASHAAAGILYLRCLHAHAEAISASDLERAVRDVLTECVERRIDPAARANLPGELAATLSYFETLGMIQRTGEAILPNASAVLATPELDPSFMQKNPIKHLVNQLLHLPDVLASLESAAFATFPSAVAPITKNPNLVG
jgi:hypothetical protein